MNRTKRYRLQISFLLISCFCFAAMAEAAKVMEQIRFIRHITGNDFKNVSYVEVDANGTLYTISKGSSLISFHDPSGKVIRTIGNKRKSKKKGELNNPSSVLVSNNGYIYVCDTGNDRINMYSHEGAYLGFFGSKGSKKGQFNKPQYISEGKDGNIYIADAGNNRIQVFSADGIFMLTFGKHKKGAKGKKGGLKSPTSLAMDKDFNIYVADTGNNKVQVFDQNGNFQFDFGQKGSDRGEFTTPVDIKVGSNGKIFVLEEKNSRLQVFDTSGKFLMEIGSEGEGRGQFLHPLAFDINQSGHLYIADTKNNRIEELAFGIVKKTVIERKKIQNIHGPKLKIGILNFKNNNNDAMGYGEIISDMLTTEIVGTSFFEVIERKELEKVVSELELGQSGIVELATQLGKVRNIDMILTGSVSKFDNLVESDIRMVNVKDGRIELVEHGKTRNDGELRTMVNNMVEKIKDIYRIKYNAPVSPTRLTALGGDKKVELRWSPNSEPDLIGYKIYRSEQANGPFRQIGKTINNHFVDAGLEHGLTFYYKVAAYDKDKLVSPQSHFSVGTTAIAPEIPSNTMGAGLIKGILLTWKPNSPVDKSGQKLMGYKLYRSETKEGKYINLANIKPELKKRQKRAEYRDSNLVDGKTYYYKLQSINGNKIQSYLSSPVAVKVLTPPEDFMVKPGGIREIKLRWTSDVGDVIKGYKLYRSLADSGSFKEIKTFKKAGDIVYTDKLKDERTYQYKVTAYDKEGLETVPSKTLSSRSKLPPDSPKGFKAVGGMIRQITLNWIPNADPDTKGYYIYRKDSENGAPLKIATIKHRKTRTYTDEGERKTPLKDDRRYYYAISSFNEVNEEGNISTTASAITKGNKNGVDGLNAESGKLRHVPLTWIPSSDQDIEGYVLHRSELPDSNYVQVAAIKKRSASRFVDEKPSKNSALRDSTVYYYKIAAVNKVGVTGPFSQPAKAKTKAPQEAPVNIKATGGLIREIVLTWRPDLDKDTAGYYIYRSDSKVGNFKRIAEVKGRDSYSYSDKPSGRDALKDAHEYYYRISSYNIVDVEGKASEPVSAVTKGNEDVAGDLSAQSGKIRHVHLSWAEVNDGDIVGYKIYRSEVPNGAFREIYEVSKRNITTYTDGSPKKSSVLKDATTYYYKLATVNRVKVVGPLSQVVSATTDGRPPVPQRLVAVNGGVQKVELKWEALNHEGIESFSIYRKNNELGTWKEIKNVRGAQSTSYVDTRLDNGTEYSYRIASVNVVDIESEPSLVVSATTKEVPSSPLGVQAKSNLVQSVLVTWQLNPERDIDSYVILASEGSSSHHKRIASVSGAENSYTHKQLKNGAGYTYKVIAIDADKLESLPSTSASATTKPIPQNVMGITGSFNQNKIRLEWNNSPEADIKEYVIYEKSFFGGKKIGSSKENHYEISVDKPDGSKRSFFIKAVDKDGLESDDGRVVGVRLPE